jgi:hypothetical protein
VRDKRKSIAAAILVAVLAGAGPDRGEAEPRAAAEPEGDRPDGEEPQEASVSENEETVARPFEWLRLTAGVGYQQVWLRTFFAEDSDTDRLTADIVPEDLSGPAASLGVGAKLWFVGFAVTGRVARLSGAAPERGNKDLSLWSVDGELTFRAPLGRVEPYVLLGAGYSSFGGLDDMVDGLGRGLDIEGLNVRGGVGAEYYLNRTLSLRITAVGDLLFLARKGVPARDLAEPEEVGTLNEAEARLLEADGSSAGFGFDLSAGLGVHF